MRLLVDRCLDERTSLARTKLAPAKLQNIQIDLQTKIKSKHMKIIKAHAQQPHNWLKMNAW